VEVVPATISTPDEIKVKQIFINIFLHLRTQRLGDTHLDSHSFRDYLEGIGKTQFEGSKYDLFQHNCNNFSNEVSVTNAFTNDTFFHYSKLLE
jgi:hypothetical protein